MQLQVIFKTGHGWFALTFRMTFSKHLYQRLAKTSWTWLKFSLIRKEKFFSSKFLFVILKIRCMAIQPYGMWNRVKSLPKTEHGIRATKVLFWPRQSKVQAARAAVATTAVVCCCCKAREVLLLLLLTMEGGGSLMVVQGRIVVVQWGVQGRHALQRNGGVDWGASTEGGGGGSDAGFHQH